MEGSATLHHWSRLATPHLGTLLEERPGVTTRETDSKHMADVKYSQDFLGISSLFRINLFIFLFIPVFSSIYLSTIYFLIETEMYSLYDVEEDEEMEMMPSKHFHTSSSVYTLTNSTVHRSSSMTRVTSA